MVATALKLITLLLLASSVLGEEVILTDKAGRPLKVKLLNISEGSVKVLSMSNRKKYDIPIDKLSDDSIQKVEDWKQRDGHLSSRFKVSYNSYKKDRKDTVGENFDDRNLIIEPKVTVANDDPFRKATKPVKMHVVILGKPVLDRKKVYILAKENFEVPSIPEFGSHSFKLKELELRYDDDNYAQYGNKYLGYAIYLLHGEKVLYSTFTPSYLESRLGTQLLDAQVYETLKP
ncbi:MAG: hypothetical protein ACPIG6_09885 [Akkermansiaceae bacterium]